MRHTPSPWEILDTHNEPRQQKIGTPDGIGHALAFGDTEEEASANARLIAAAPDLLAALKTCRAWVAQYHDLKGHDAASRHLTDYLDRVISTAEGEAV